MLNTGWYVLWSLKFVMLIIFGICKKDKEEKKIAKCEHKSEAHGFFFETGNQYPFKILHL